MKILGLSITEIIAIVTAVSGIIFGLMKFYNLFMYLAASIERLNKLMSGLDAKYDDHDTRITRLEEKTKTLFRSIGGNKK